MAELTDRLNLPAAGFYGFEINTTLKTYKKSPRIFNNKPKKHFINFISKSRLDEIPSFKLLDRFYSINIYNSRTESIIFQIIRLIKNTISAITGYITDIIFIRYISHKSPNPHN